MYLKGLPEDNGPNLLIWDSIQISDFIRPVKNFLHYNVLFSQTLGVRNISLGDPCAPIIFIRLSCYENHHRSTKSHNKK